VVADTGTVPAGLRIPRREVWADLPEEYAGFRVKLWINYPRRLQDDLRSGDTERVSAALSQLVLEHNGWQDEDGTPLPPTTDPTFWQAIPDELAAVVIITVNREAQRLPNSLASRKVS
jgi:hypothetical protein